MALIMNPAGPRTKSQISIGLMLLMMGIFAVMSAGLFYASRVGAIREELTVLTGSAAPESGPPDRVAHLVFLMFTYTSPLLLALLLGLIHGWRRNLGSQRSR